MLTALLRQLGLLVHAVHSVKTDKGGVAVARIMGKCLELCLDIAQHCSSCRANEAALLGVIPLLIQWQVRTVWGHLLHVRESVR